MGFWSKLGRIASIAAPIVAAPFTGGASLALIGAGAGAAGGALSGGGWKGALMGAGLGAIPGGGAAGSAAGQGVKAGLLQAGKSALRNPAFLTRAARTAAAPDPQSPQDLQNAYVRQALQAHIGTGGAMPRTLAPVTPAAPTPTPAPTTGGAGTTGGDVGAEIDRIYSKYGVKDAGRGSGFTDKAYWAEHPSEVFNGRLERDLMGTGPDQPTGTVWGANGPPAGPSGRGGAGETAQAPPSVPPVPAAPSAPTAHVDVTAPLNQDYTGQQGAAAAAAGTPSSDVTGATPSASLSPWDIGQRLPRMGMNPEDQLLAPYDNLVRNHVMNQLGGGGGASYGA